MNILLNERYLFAGFMLDLVAGRFFADGAEVQLRPKSFALLSYMVRNAGRVVSKDELMTALWPDVTVTEDSLTQCVRDVRRALNDDGAAMLRTLPRRGYMLDIEVKSPRDVPPGPVAEMDAPGTLPVDQILTEGSPGLVQRPATRGEVGAGQVDAAQIGSPVAQPAASHSRWRWGILAAGIVAVVLAALAFWGKMPTNAPALPAPPLSLAIVPFANQTGDPEKEFVATGMPSNIETILWSSPLFRYTELWRDRRIDKPDDARDLATDGRVDLVLDGSISLASPGYRFLGQLYDGPSGLVVTTFETEVPDGDLARLQYLVAEAVVTEVAARAGQAAAASLDPGWGRTSAQPDEYSFFLRGQTALRASDFSGKDDATKVVELGLARYPQSVPLRLLKAQIHVNRTFSGPAKESWDNASQAWTILSGLPEASSLPLMERRYLHFLRALVTRLATGDFEAGMRDAEAAWQLNPYAMSDSIDLAQVAADAGHGARAVEWVRATMREDPEPSDWQRDVLAWALVIDGRPEEALAEYARIQHFCMACKVVALVRTGRLDQARTLVETMRRERPFITIAHERNWPTGHQPIFPEPFLSAYLDDLRKAGLPETGPPPP